MTDHNHEYNLDQPLSPPNEVRMTHEDRHYHHGGHGHDVDIVVNTNTDSIDSGINDASDANIQRGELEDVVVDDASYQQE